MIFRIVIAWKVIVALAVLVSVSGSAVAEPPLGELQRWAIDEDQETFNTEMNVVIFRKESPVAVWKGYQEGKDQIFRRILDLNQEEVGEAEVISGKEDAIGMVSISFGEGMTQGRDFCENTVTWSAMGEGSTWSLTTLQSQKREGGDWGDLDKITFRGDRAFSNGYFWPFQRLEDNQKSSLYYAALGGNRGDTYDRYANDNSLRFRPIEADGWTFWDEYLKSGDRRIFGKPPTDDPDSIVPISPPEPGARCITLPSRSIHCPKGSTLRG